MISLPARRIPGDERNWLATQAETASPRCSLLFRETWFSLLLLLLPLSTRRAGQREVWQENITSRITWNIF
ncbi:hypothetical protein E2C01_002278 [Portunus trituberculatus]|uniref:Uncharacterized protein n=1 Tax=Portunus trituberculatus TaxID=210409 RepID=A0A5B7CQA5_PORTR|nr:hypothetical protein [Portunus trituberculatus]